MKRKPLHHLQETIRKRGLDRITGHYKVKVTLHPKYRNLHMFKYNQIDSPMGSLVVQACRGIILDADNDWAPVCHTYNKFFNLGEGHAAEIDWNTAKVFEKLDGSIMQLFWYDNQWNVATSGTPDANCEVPHGKMTFKDLFWQTWADLKYDTPQSERNCYAFELMTKYNHVVVRHEKPRLVLHGIRDMQYGFEYDARIHCQNWEVAKVFDFGYNDTCAALLNMDGMHQEGFVIVDGAKNRVKMKCEDYVRKHRLVSSLSHRNLIDIIRQNEATEFLVYFPEWAKEYDILKDEYEDLVKDIELMYDQNKNIQSQKDFAAAVKQHRFSGCLFQLRNKKVHSVREHLKNMNIKHLEQAMEKRR